MRNWIDDDDGGICAVYNFTTRDEKDDNDLTLLGLLLFPPIFRSKHGTTAL